jgi:S-adenosylmethionine synthetase
LLKYSFTSESVTEGHPDKVCDQIADAILDYIIQRDPDARVACEVTATMGLIHVMGEISTKIYADITKIARETVCSIGYDGLDAGFDGKTCGIITSINSQSKDIALGVDHSLEEKMGMRGNFNKIGAGDQGIVFGFACNETSTLMPLPIFFANDLALTLSRVRKEKIVPYLMPDGKTQVTVEYENSVPKRVSAIVISAQHRKGVSIDQIRRDLMEHVIEPVIRSRFLDDQTQIFINPTGRFVNGGPGADSGLTGRKIMVDTYGGYSKHGGGAFSGKDPTKVDRSGAYIARYIAKNIVAAKIATKCEVGLSYVIGVASPISITLNTFGTSKIPEEKIISAVKKVFDMRPSAIIKQLDLYRPIYKDLAAYGHMGREFLDLEWEKTNKTEVLLETLEEDILIQKKCI